LAKKAQTPPAVRDEVFARDRGRCIRCGSPGGQVHHRQPRRIGGHGKENLALACATCHEHFHAHPREARENGWIVSIHSPDIAAVPIATWYGTAFLHPDGTITVG
jgi:hypothetical protein